LTVCDFYDIRKDKGKRMPRFPVKNDNLTITARQLDKKLTRR